MPRAHRVVSAILPLLLAGCLSPEPADGSDVADDAPALDWPDELRVRCTICVEPIVSWTPDGALLVGDHANTLVRVEANGTQTPHPLPPLPKDTVRSEPDLLLHDGALYYALNAHPDTDPNVANAPTVYNNVVPLFVDDGTGWRLLQEFRPGTTQTVRTGGVDRPWLAAAGDTLVVAWNLAGGQPGNEVVVSRDRGATFDEPYLIAYSAHSTTSTIGGRPAVADDGTVLVPVVYGDAGTGSGAHETTRPGVGGIVLHRLGHDGWETLELGPWTGDAAPHRDTFATGATWSPELGFVLTWQGPTGTVWGSTSPDGRTWTEPEAVWRLDHAGLQPFAVAHGTTVTLSLTAKSATTTWHHMGTWEPLDGTSHEELAFQVPFNARGEWSHQAVRADGTAAHVFNGGDGLRVLIHGEPQAPAAPEATPNQRKW